MGRFVIDGLEIEVYGESLPVKEQNGYRHMLAEALFLDYYGEGLREKVRDLKRRGVKTEPAFARCLELDGNPYEAVLQHARELKAL